MLHPLCTQQFSRFTYRTMQNPTFTSSRVIVETGGLLSVRACFQLRSDQMYKYVFYKDSLHAIGMKRKVKRKREM